MLTSRSHWARSRWERLAVAALGAVVTGAGTLGACSAGPSSFPDRSVVVAAQAEWCDELARVIGGGPSWEHLAACKADFPTASGGYLRLMTKCFTRRLEAAGTDAPDRATIIADCNEEVLVHLPDDEAAAREVTEARCERMTKCEGVPAAECKAGFAKLEAAQRALFTTVYNAAGRYEVVDCLRGASCTDNEEAGREACYKPAADKLLWFPP